MNLKKLGDVNPMKEPKEPTLRGLVEQFGQAAQQWGIDRTLYSYDEALKKIGPYFEAKSVFLNDWAWSYERIS